MGGTNHQNGRSSHAPSTAVWRACARYKDTVKGNLQWCGIQLKELEASESDRSQWCSPTLTAPTSFETTAVTDSWQQPMNDAKEHSLLISQQRSSNAPPATHDSALPDWVCRATRESMDDHTTQSLLPTRWTTTKQAPLNEEFFRKLRHILSSRTSFASKRKQVM